MPYHTGRSQRQVLFFQWQDIGGPDRTWRIAPPLVYGENEPIRSSHLHQIASHSTQQVIMHVDFCVTIHQSPASSKQ